MPNNTLTSHHNPGFVNTWSGKNYFPNLDALRFIAFFGVFGMHCWKLNLESFQLNAFTIMLKDWSAVGSLGVNFFFVLSGFLITYLLLSEQKEKNHFSIPKFYLRRILRIWPLYFAIILLSYCILPFALSLTGKIYSENFPLIYALTFTMNFAHLASIFSYSPLLSGLWTIAIEEQFYLVWPWFLKTFKKILPALFISLLAACVAYRIYFIAQPRMIYYSTFSVLSDFALGGLLAFLCLTKNNFLKIISVIPKYFSAIAYFIIALLIIFYQQIFTGDIMIVIERPVFSLAFAFIICDQAFNANRIFNAGKFQAINWLGKISYGLYCFHTLAIVLAKDVLMHFNFINQPWQYMLVFPILALGITIFISAFSFYFFEKIFLNMKGKISLSAT